MIAIYASTQGLRSPDVGSRRPEALPALLRKQTSDCCEMATGGNVPELGGYDYEFASSVPEYWECLVCHLTMKDPVQIVGCGHRLCSMGAEKKI